MKPVIIFVVAAGVFGVGLLIQLGVMPRGNGDAKSQKEAPVKPVAKTKARFPEDLAPAAQAKAVAIAAEYKPGAKSYRVAFVNPRGELHRWHPDIPEDWRAATVEETELVVVMDEKQKRIFVDRINYANAPAIDRYINQVEIAIVEPKTGKVIENRMFRNLPRQVHNIEAFRTTMIGRSVQWFTVFDYVAKHSQAGFPDSAKTNTVDTIVE